MVYCYGDPSARSLPGAQLAEEHGEAGGLLSGLASYSLLDIAQLAVYSLGILAMYVAQCQHQLLILNHYHDCKSVKCQHLSSCFSLVALILIRNSVLGLERHLAAVWTVLDAELGEDTTEAAAESSGGRHLNHVNHRHAASTNNICDL